MDSGVTSYRLVFWTQGGCRMLVTRVYGDPHQGPAVMGLSHSHLAYFSLALCIHLLDPFFLFLESDVHVVLLLGQGPISILICHNLSASTPTAIFSHSNVLGRILAPN